MSFAIYNCFVIQGSLEMLADPTRRRILELLLQRERSVGELVARFTLTQPAISRHLAALRAAGLVTVRRDGRLRVYRLRAEPLAELADWLEPYREQGVS
ncbi:MAG: metalloregulator ArsR/SmtB family transcription factor [Solirubrobacteraceae bacterium]|jgi:DNA-binding transcriptional ArsR family regulator